MDVEAKRIEEGLRTTDENHDLKDSTIKDEHEHQEESRVALVESHNVRQIEQEQPLVKQKPKRIATLDAFRGLTVVVIISSLHVS